MSVHRVCRATSRQARRQFAHIEHNQEPQKRKQLPCVGGGEYLEGQAP